MKCSPICDPNDAKIPATRNARLSESGMVNFFIRVR
jgi:hypothetical protein